MFDDTPPCKVYHALPVRRAVNGALYAFAFQAGGCNDPSVAGVFNINVSGTTRVEEFDTTGFRSIAEWPCTFNLAIRVQAD